MRLIDADAVVTIQTYDDMYEEWGSKTMTVAEAMDEFSDEGCPPAVDAVEVVRCKDCAHKRNEGPILRCPYSTVDLEPGGYCDKGLPNAMREGLQNIKEMEKKKVSF